MTDYEMWLEIATHMEESGKIPNYGIGKAPGLCVALLFARVSSYISFDVMNRMIAALRKEFATNSDPSCYFWPPYETAPRIAACRRMAEIAAANGGNHVEP